MLNHEQLILYHAYNLAISEEGRDIPFDMIIDIGYNLPDYVDDYWSLAMFIACELGAVYPDGDQIVDEDMLSDWDELKAKYAND